MEYNYVTAALAAALVVFAASLGIAHIGGHAVDGIARQPEAAADVRIGMILSAALIEGVALLAEIVCILVVLLK